MKQETGKKNKRWLWLVLALAALLVVAGVVLALLLPGQQEGPGNETVNAELYWNVDRMSYLEEETGMSTRTAADDGMYHMLFAYKGQQLELAIADKQLVNFIDSMDLMGLIFDANGVVVDAVEATAVATEAANKAYVKSFEDGKLILNSSQAMNGMPFEFEVTENTGIYDVSSKAEIVGQVSEPGIMDQVLVYANAQEEITHVYIVSRPVDAELYWRVERMWDSEKQVSTREPDENGVWTVQFAYKGELVDLKTRDISVVNNIDAHALLQGQFAFLFDEEGYIIDNVDIGLALRGMYLASDYHITAIDGDTYTATKMSGASQGDVITFTLAEGCEIFQCCQFGCYDHHCGEYTDHLNLYDRVNVYSDLDGNATVIFVTRRIVGGDAKVYYNMERKYGGDAVGTTRTKQNGYYVYEMMVDGKLTTVRVKDKKMADAIDLPYNRCSGLVLDGDIVTKVYSASCVIGGPNYANETPVTALMGPVVTITSTSTGESRNFIMSADCKVYNAITGEYGKEVGGEIQLQQGDYITAYTDYKDELGIVFVVTRPVEGAKVYYNLERKYNSKLAETTREPDADGYYVFLMACEGKQVTVKTKSKGMATFIDSQSAPLAGLKVNKSGIITNAYTVTSVLQNEGKTCNYHYVRDLNTKAGTFGTYYVIDGVRTDPPAVQKIAKNCKIYNVSTTYEEFRGEKATLKNGDQIQAIKDLTTGEITKIFIMQRDPTYGFESYKASCAHCGKTVTWQPYGGTIAAGDGHYYACGDFMVNQGTIGKEDDGKVYDVVLDLKGHSITSSGRAFLVYDKLTVLDSVGGGKVVGTTTTGTTGSTVLLYDKGELNLMGGTLTLSDKSTVFGNYGGVVYMGSGSVFNMTGGKITDGICAGRGGNVYVNGGTFNMTGGTISGGTAAAGDNIFISANGVMNVSNATIDGGIFMLGAPKISLSGKTVISGSGMEIPAGTKIAVDGLTSGASIVVSGNGIFTGELTNVANYLQYFKVAAEGDSIAVDGNALNYNKKPVDYNSLDNSNLSFAPGTTNAYCPVCEKTVTWTALTADKAITLAGGSHYYLASDLTFDVGDKNATFITAPTTGMKACVHLNGHNVSSTVSRVFHGNAGTLNIMGNGTVTGGYVTGGYIHGATVGINTSVASGQINLIGGTYVSSVTNTPVVSISDNGGTVNMYSGATIRGTADSNAVNIGKAGLTNAAFNLFGGTVEGGMINMSGAQNDNGNTATVLFAGGKLTSGIQVVENCNVKVEGSPVISGLNIKQGVLINVGELSSGAEISVSADGVFTNVLSNAEAVKTYFKPARVNAEIQIVDNALSYVQIEKDLNTVDNSDLEFTSGTNAMCPVCGYEVTWTALTDAAVTLEQDGHYYLPDSITYTGSEAAYITAPGLGSVACVHLNGHDITATAHRVFEGNNSTLNIMGEGTVSGSYNGDRLYGATVNAAGANGKVNLIGGTYTKNEACNVCAIVLIRGGDVNMYSGAQIVGVSDSGKLTNVQVYNNAFNMYGGKLSGGAGAQITTNNWNATVTGIARIYGGEISGNVMINGSADRKHGTFVMEGGKITGYLYLGKGTDATISGGTINATVAIGSGTTNEVSSLTLSGAPVITGNGLTVPEGYKLTLGELTADASIKLSATGVFTLTNDKAGEYTGCFVPAEGFEVVAKDNALVYQQTGAVEEPDDPEEPTEPEDELNVDANGYAECPVCKKNVQWIDLNAQNDSRLGHKNDKASYDAGTVLSYHYYLSDDLAYTGNVQFAERYYNINCLHLNGHSLNFNSRMWLGAGAVLNIMGTGSVTSSCDASATANNPALLYAYSGAVINLYGGSYSSTNASAPTIFIPYTATTQVNIHDGVTVTGGVKANNGTVTISGNSVIDSLTIGSSAKLTVKEDWSGTASASFAALADNTIPTANGISEGEYAGKLTLDTAAGYRIYGKNGALVIDNSVDPEVARGNQVAAAANAMTFPTNKTNSEQTCPACGTAVVWKPLSGRLGDVNDGAHHHYYLTNDVTSEYQFITLTSGAVCLHMNGYDVDVVSRIFVSGCELNIMGKGAITCLGTAGTQTGAVTIGANATANIYGGTIASVAESGTPAIKLMNANTAVVNLYADAVVGGEKGTCTGANVVVEKGTFNMYGGTVQNGIGFVYNNQRQGGNIFMYTGTAFNMYAGTVTGGKADVGGNICATNATLNIHDDAVISAGESTSHGGNFQLVGTCVLTTDGKIQNGKATGSAAHGGNISITQGCTLVVCGGEISGGVAAGQGGNIRAWNAAITMTDGVIYGGDSVANVNDNVWAAGTSVMTMLGGTVKGTDGTAANGTAITLSQTAVLHLGGDAKVIRDDGVHTGNIYVTTGSAESAALRVLNNWTGTASVKWGTNFSTGTAVDAACGSCGTLTEGVYTAGGSHTGTLVYEPDQTCLVVGENGELKITAAQ